MLQLKVILGVLVALTIASASEVPREVNICDVTRLAGQLDGKVVRVRGLLRNSDTSEDPSFDELVPEGCSNQEGSQTVIHIVSPDTHFLSHPPQGYKPDMNSVRRAEPIFKKAAADGKPVLGTVEGVFHAMRREIAVPPRHKQYSASIVIQALRGASEH